MLYEVWAARAASKVSLDKIQAMETEYCCVDGARALKSRALLDPTAEVRSGY